MIRKRSKTVNEVVDASPLITSSKKVWFKNFGGTHRAKDGRIIKPGQKFKEYPENVPEQFRDKIRPTEELPPEPPVVPVTGGYTVRARENAIGWFDVVDADGKAVNEKALRPDDADELVKDLNEI